MKNFMFEKKDVKIFVLYLLEKINYPLEYVTINDIVRQNDLVSFIDFAECFAEMLDDKLIIDTSKSHPPMYVVSDKGSYVARTLQSEIIDSILDMSLQSALRFLTLKQRKAEVVCITKELSDGKFQLYCALEENKQVVFSSTLIVQNEAQAERMKSKFKEKPDIVYKGVLALLTGDMDYLFESSKEN